MEKISEDRALFISCMDGGADRRFARRNGPGAPFRKPRLVAQRIALGASLAPTDPVGKDMVRPRARAYRQLLRRTDLSRLSALPAFTMSSLGGCSLDGLIAGLRPCPSLPKALRSLEGSGAGSVAGVPGDPTGYDFPFHGSPLSH